MSNQFLKLRRSAVPGKVPTTSSLEFGEIALNTFDGLAFIKKSGSNGEEIVTIGNTTGAFTGSFSGSFIGNLQGTASWAINAITASYALNAGTGNVSGSQYYVAVFSGSSSVTTGSIYDSGSFTAIGATSSIHIDAPERFLVEAGETDSYNLISGHGSINNYIQLNVKNFSSGITASSDIVATNNIGDEESYFINMGINGDGYNIDGGIGSQNDAYLYSTGENLLIGNASEGKSVILFNGTGSAIENARVFINPGGTVGINTSDTNISNPESLLVEPLTTSPTQFNNLIIGRGIINESYLQFNLINRGTGSYASADIVASNDASTEVLNYIDMGINASTHIFDPSFAPGTGNDTYLLSTGKNLLIGSATSGSLILWTSTDFNNEQSAKLILKYNNQHEISGSINVSGSIFNPLITQNNSLSGSLVAVNPSTGLFQYTNTAATASSADDFTVRSSGNKWRACFRK